MKQWKIKKILLALIHHIKENNVQVGISIKPNTPVDAIQDYLSLLDVVLVMSVEPGFGGQSFKEIALDKIKDLASRRKDNNYNYLIEVDGGINESTGKQCKEAGVDVLVAGSYVFNSEDCSQRIASFKMKIALCATHLEKMILPQDREYIGVDHGVEELLKQGITPKFAIGDFDSLQNRQTLENLNIQILPERKDVTDTHVAIEYAISKGYDEIELYGVTGGRLDHFFAVMCLLEKYQDVSIKVIDQQNCIQLLKPGIHHIYNQEYYYFSLFALNESILSISQAEYTLDHYLLKRDDPLCVSNEVKGDYTIIENNENIILVRSRDAK